VPPPSTDDALQDRSVEWRVGVMDGSLMSVSPPSALSDILIFLAQCDCQWSIRVV